jgi:hypothetical protein
MRLWYKDLIKLFKLKFWDKKLKFDSLVFFGLKCKYDYKAGSELDRFLKTNT